MSCAECGLDYEAMPPEDTIVAIRGFARRYRAPLTRLLRGEDESVLRTRPAPETWSPLEYAVHVREVFGLYAAWVDKVLSEDQPVLEIPGGGLDQPAGENEAVPGDVAEELARNAESLAAALEAVPDGGWERTGVRHGQPRSVALMARTAVHEGSHHLLDIGRGLRTVRTRTGPQ